MEFLGHELWGPRFCRALGREKRLYRNGNITIITLTVLIVINIVLVIVTVTITFTIAISIAIAITSYYFYFIITITMIIITFRKCGFRFTRNPAWCANRRSKIAGFSFLSQNFWCLTCPGV